MTDISDKGSTLNHEAYGLELIMNTNKLAKKQDTTAARNHIHNRLMKSFQILETCIANDNDTASLVNEFALYFENKITDIITTFHKERIGKID